MSSVLAVISDNFEIHSNFMLESYNIDLPGGRGLLTVNLVFRMYTPYKLFRTKQDFSNWVTAEARTTTHIMLFARASELRT